MSYVPAPDAFYTLSTLIRRALKAIIVPIFQKETLKFRDSELSKIVSHSMTSPEFSHKSNDTKVQAPKCYANYYANCP